MVVIEPPEGEGDASRNFTSEMREMTVSNARLMESVDLLEKEGFTLIKDKTLFKEFDSFERIRERYYPACVQMVIDTMGASAAFAFDHNIRVDGNSEEHRKPAGITHVDLTEASARRILGEQIPGAGYESAAGKRFVFVNTWRPLINPVYNAHLAFCAASSVPEISLLRAELRYEDRIGELYYCAHHEKHRWYYFPQMTCDEVLLLKNYDSASDGRASFAPHTAIQDPTAPANAPRRQSIEVRIIALFDK